MKTEIIKQEKNPFLGREELTVTITEEAMPTKEGVVEALGKDKDLTIIKKINSNFGRNSFSAEVVIYNDKESKDKYMTIPKKVRAKMEADKKEAEATAKKAAEEEAKAAEEAKIAAETPAKEISAEEKIEETKPGEKTE